MGAKPSPQFKHHDRSRPRPNGKGRYDTALIQAKQEGKTVELGLALEDRICDSNAEDLIATVKILEVDTYAIRVASIDTGRESWISKSFIVSASIL